jgi:hypothetical protein
MIGSNDARAIDRAASGLHRNQFRSADVKISGQSQRSECQERFLRTLPSIQHPKVLHFANLCHLGIVRIDHNDIRSEGRLQLVCERWI